MELTKTCDQPETDALPADWTVKACGQISTPVRGGSPRPAGDPRYFDGSFIPWLTVSALTGIPESRLSVSETETCLTEEGASFSRTLNPGVLIIANSGATLGVAKILGIKCCANDGIAALLNLDLSVSPRYLAHYLNTQTERLRQVVATGNGQPNLNTKLISDIRIPVPPSRQEQDRIASALDDVDALIESLERLIAKKRQIKQGAMQELLAGKKRLPGFTGGKPWRLLTIGEVADVKTGPFGSALHEKDYVEDGTPIITVEHLGERGITRRNLPMVSEEDRRRLVVYSLREGDIVFSRVGSVDRNAWVSKDEEGWLFSGRLLRLRATDGDIDTRYLSYQFHSEPFKERVRSVAVGQTMSSLNTKLLSSVSVSLPPPSEQTAIASVLMDMDAEIEAFEAKLAKARQIKEGMAQALLTGRIRLV